MAKFIRITFYIHLEKRTDAHHAYLDVHEVEMITAPVKSPGPFIVRMKSGKELSVGDGDAASIESALRDRGVEL